MKTLRKIGDLIAGVLLLIAVLAWALVAIPIITMAKILQAVANLLGKLYSLRKKVDQRV